MYGGSLAYTGHRRPGHDLQGRVGRARREQQQREATRISLEIDEGIQEARKLFEKRKKAVKVLLLGSGDSGKSTILKQMRLIHRVPFSSQEIESYRQLIFNNLTHGLKNVIDAMEDMELEVSPENQDLVPIIEDASDIKDGEPFPTEFHDVLKRLWEDPFVQAAYARGNEAALPEK